MIRFCDLPEFNADDLPEWEFTPGQLGFENLEFSDDNPVYYVCTESGEAIAKVSRENYMLIQSRADFARLRELNRTIDKATKERDLLMQKYNNEIPVSEIF